MKTIRTIIPILAIFVLLVKPATARILVKVTWDFSEIQISPNPGPHSENNEGTVFDIEGHTTTDSNGTKIAANVLQSSNRTDGVPYKVKVFVKGNKLVKEIHISGLNERVIVTTNGIDACTASVLYYKSAGQRYLQRIGNNNEQIHDSYQAAANVVCTISK